MEVWPSDDHDLSPDRLLRLPEVLQIFPVSRSAWYQGIAQGRYPAGIKLSVRTVAWRKSDIDALARSLVRSGKT
jgi:predicted DNA-binding transcriptional regulator AlpA